MSYSVSIRLSADKELCKLPEAVQKRIASAIGTLASDPRPVGCVKLTGFDNAHRIRVGSYRVVYSVNDRLKTVTVEAVGDRKEIYRRY